MSYTYSNGSGGYHSGRWVSKKDRKVVPMVMLLLLGPIGLLIVAIWIYTDSRKNKAAKAAQKEWAAAEYDRQYALLSPKHRAWVDNYHATPSNGKLGWTKLDRLNAGIGISA